MDDDRAIELYAQFRASYQTKRVHDIVQQPNLSGGQTMTAPMIPYIESADDFLRELFNSVNDFRRWINTLDAWRQVYESCDEIERLSLLVEHIRPYSTLALGGPQAIRGRIMYAAAICCGHANYVLHGDNPNLQWDGVRNLNMKIASGIGQPWANWKELAPILSNKLGYGAIHDLTDNYRNHHEHGHPRNIGMGLTASVAVSANEKGQRMWSFGPREAITLEIVIEQTAEQHALAVEAYNLLCALAKEQFEALMQFTNSLYPFSPLPVIDGPWKGKKQAYSIGTFEVQGIEIANPLTILQAGVERVRYYRQKNTSGWVWSIEVPENACELLRAAEAEIRRFFPD